MRRTARRVRPPIPPSRSAMRTRPGGATYAQFALRPTGREGRSPASPTGSTRIREQAVRGSGDRCAGTPCRHGRRAASRRWRRSSSGRWPIVGAFEPQLSRAPGGGAHRDHAGAISATSTSWTGADGAPAAALHYLERTSRARIGRSRCVEGNERVIRPRLERRRDSSTRPTSARRRSRDRLPGARRRRLPEAARLACSTRASA